MVGLPFDRRLDMRTVSRILLVAALSAAPLSEALALPRLFVACGVITAPGTYIALANINATGDCLVVQSDFVTIDLGGYVITGNGTGSGIVESQAVGRRGITVRNGFVTNFQNGIALSNSSGVRVENMNVTGNLSQGINLGGMSTALRNTVAFNGGTGIALGQRGLAEGNNVSENIGSGISVDLGGNVTGNTVGRNQASGILASEGALVSGNVSRNNGGNGITVDCPAAVIGNTSSNNLGANLHVIGNACDPNEPTCCVQAAHNSTM
jgi:Right handed beta helix region